MIIYLCKPLAQTLLTRQVPPKDQNTINSKRGDVPLLLKHMFLFLSSRPNAIYGSCLFPLVYSTRQTSRSTKKREHRKHYNKHSYPLISAFLSN